MFSKKRLDEAFSFLKDYTGIKSAVILSTCNRVEIYANSAESMAGADKIAKFLSVYHEIDKYRLAPYLYKYVDIEAARHLFRVASGLDSQILGETQVLGQVQWFYEKAKTLGFTDNLIEEVFEKAEEVGKRIRVETDISKGDISIGSAVVSLIKERIGELKAKKILIIGLGKISEIVLKDLLKEDVKAVLVSNRTYEKAKQIAKTIGAAAIRFNELRENLKGADIIISATSSPHIILRVEDIREVIEDRPKTIDHRQLLIIDLAVPRDVDPGAREIKGVKLYCLDDLTSIIDNKLEGRNSEISNAEKIIEEEAHKVWRKITAIKLGYGVPSLR
ncbi:MAG: glutamyl-tRNA reductase [Omnitrophica bacterium RIFCSPLOWO2_01_FULL_45_10]|nr:MAG: glutamyl-tRNA reductase [Omnitrophica bacterium RIFCSPLOWO2_01_FULL_45_10]